jgi:signal transduction histidine kinase/FixJ family two-component response regulator
MVIPVSGFHQHVSLSTERLLIHDETIVIVDDDPGIRSLVKDCFAEHGLPAVETSKGSELFSILSIRNVALVLLDIGLPDVDGVSILPKLVEQYPDIAVIMLSGVSDIHVALDCIRKGAEDYLAKPVRFNDIYNTVRKALEKRRLIIENRKYQEELEKAHFRIKLVHQLSMKMNTVYLSTVELDEILQAILVGITANEGLRFNRAFLALFDSKGEYLQGQMAIGPGCREEAQSIWSEMQDRGLGFYDIVQNIKETCQNNRVDSTVNKIVKKLRVSANEHDNILIKATRERQSIQVINGQADYPVPDDLLEILSEDNFIIVPLFSPGRTFGVIIADNFVTRQEINSSYVTALELFASQASLAIEHSHLYMDMETRLRELKTLNRELDQNKDLLVEAERFSALGQMAAQMVHMLRNPITSIGGVSRILAKKIDNPKFEKYLAAMVKETGRLESTLEDLFDFVNLSPPKKEKVAIYSLVRKTLLLVKSAMARQKIEYELDFPDPEPLLNLDYRQIQQVFLHLIKNAIEAMPDGGKLTLQAKIHQKWLYFIVVDTGIGIPEQQFENAKSPFFTTKTYGTGMGLAMAEKVLQAHNGTFVMEKMETGGIKVQINLPII